MATNAFQPAIGGTSRGEANLSGMSKQYSARDMPANKTLKNREKGQHTQDELRLKDREGMRRELEERERNIRDKQRPSSDTKRITSGGTTTSTTSRSKPAITETNIDADDPLDESSDDEETSSRQQTKATKHAQQNREEDEEDNDEDDDDGDDDEDDTAELMAELARIKRERAAEAARLEQQKRAEEEKIRMENILRGNPLLNATKSGPSTTNDFRVKRRWDDDVVFKNCAKGDSGSGEKRVAQFVNDSLRSEFHRRFMDKYIK